MVVILFVYHVIYVRVVHIFVIPYHLSRVGAMGSSGQRALLYATSTATFPLASQDQKVSGKFVSFGGHNQ